MNLLVTGGAGFIGAALCHRLLDRGDRVLAVDNLSAYYDVQLKQARLDRLLARESFTFRRLDIADRAAVAALFADGGGEFDAVIHLAAQAGVRHSIDNPAAYTDANLLGFGNILEGCRHAKVPHLLFASSSSVYGDAAELPSHETTPVNRPLSFYAATKAANELMAHAYAHLYQLRCTGLRFFTVYGPWGRPDMAFFKFTELMLRGAPIPVYNGGELTRDFTYIDDVVDGTLRALDATAAADTTATPYQIYNLGNGSAVPLMRYIRALERALGVSATLNMLPMQDGDVAATHADMRALAAATGFAARTDIDAGLAHFAAWYRDYYGAPS